MSVTPFKKNWKITKNATFSKSYRVLFDEQTGASITQSGGTATVTLDNHCWSTNDYVYVKGANECEYNGVHQITKIDNDSFSFTVDSGTDSPATGTIIIYKVEDLTNDAISVDIKLSQFESTALLSLTEGSGITVYGTSGLIEIEVTDTVTGAIDWVAGVYDIRREMASGEVHIIGQGNVDVVEAVTRG